MRKKLALVAATVALGAFLVVGGTLAWFTASDDATNKITVGGLNIEVTEEVPTVPSGEVWTAKKAGEGENVHIAYGNIVPGATIIKEPIIKYTGSANGYVRYKVEIDVTGLPENVTEEEFLKFVKFYKDGNDVTETLLKTKWAGNYVYDANAWTPNKAYEVFDSVKFSGDMDNRLNDSDLELKIKVVADAVQASNFEQDLNAQEPWGNINIETGVVTPTSAPVNE